MEMPGVHEARELLRRGETTSRELVERALAAIDEADAELNAFVHLDPDGARAAADDVDATPPERRGPLAGVPFAVKDLQDCAGMPTTRGSRWYADRGPVERDDLSVGRLRAAGAVPLGKTAPPEFGTWAYTASPLLGVTRNPWDPSRTPGGSSGGSAAAVSAGLVPFATADDGGGSTRIPAAFTGLVGLKPCYGRVPTYDMTHLAQNAASGALTTTVADQALLLDVMAGPDPADRTCLPAPDVRYADAVESLDTRGLRAAWSVDLGVAVVDPEVAEICERAARTLVEAAGLTPVAGPVTFDDPVGVYTRIEGVDMFVGHDPVLWRERLDELDPLVAPGWRSAAGATLPKLAAVEEARQRIVARAAEVFADVDVVLTPMTAVPAFAAEGPMPTEVAGHRVHGGMSVVFGMFANLVNLPAVSVPAGVTSDGLPVGLQVIGRRFREDVCLRLARVLEQAAPWPRWAPGR